MMPGEAYVLERGHEAGQEAAVLLVEQPAGGLAHDAIARGGQVEPDHERRHRIEPGDARQLDEHEPDDHADAGLEVGQHVASRRR